MILGTGIDVIDFAKFDRAMDSHGSRFLQKVFTDREIEYCRSKARPVQHFAGRFAAKEAVMKALHTGWSNGVSWKGIEVSVESSGVPSVRLSGGARARAEAIGLKAVHLSISHSGDYAIASATIEG